MFFFFKKSIFTHKTCVCVCVCVCVRARARARVHKIKVHTNLLTLATVRSRRIEVEVSFHTFKKKKLLQSCQLQDTPQISNHTKNLSFQASPGLQPAPTSTQGGGQPSSLRLAPSPPLTAQARSLTRRHADAFPERPLVNLRAGPASHPAAGTV